LERETGSNAPSTNQRVEFVYRGRLTKAIGLPPSLECA
jgi:hypothetical protein